jgi:hypothetical protein
MTRLPKKLIRVPNPVRKQPIQRAASTQVGFLELFMWLKREASVLDEPQETWVVLVALRMKRPGQQILGVVMRQLLLVW